MNIAVLAKKTTLHKGYGGLETQNRVICEELAKRGHSVTVFSPDWEISEDQAIANGVNYRFVKCVYRMGPIFGFFGTLQRSNWLNRSYQELKLVHSRSAFDLVLAQSSTGLGVIKHKKELNLKVISIAHGSIIGEYKTFINSMQFPRDVRIFIQNTGFTLKNFFRRQREFVHGSDKVIAVSNYVKQALLDETFCDEQKIVVINNGIDPKIFDAISANQHRGKKFLYVGQITKSKGLEDLFKLFLTHEFEKQEIDLIGTGEYLQELSDKVNKIPGMSARFRLLGLCPYDQVVKKFYENLDYGVFLMPTKRYEGLPMVLIEAMFSGLCTVVYNVGGVSDAVYDQKTGFLVKPNDIQEFSKKALSLVENDATRYTFGEFSVQYARSKFAIETIIDQYEQVMKEVISENN